MKQVKCNNCGYIGTVIIGLDICPMCNTEGLEWYEEVKEENKETEE